MHRQTTSVVIIGAGPAGLVLGNLLRAARVDCVVLERSSREHIEQRARAGYLAANSVRILDEGGLASGLRAHGRRHDTCAFRGEEGEFELNYSRLGRSEVHTVYPQQDLVRDLVAEYLARGGELRFETAARCVHDADTHRPWVEYEGREGRGGYEGSFIAGCDGQHGVAVQAIPAAAVQRHARDHGVSWLATLAQAPQSMPGVTYAIHDDGFAGHMARSPQVTRYYMQCEPGEDPRAWSDARIWESLRRRFRTHEYGALAEGAILERGIVHLRSVVLEPIQYGRLFLVGDAASLISPSAAKGANLAIMEAQELAHALLARLKLDDESPLKRYSAACLPRIWRAQEFSHWMIQLLHGPAGDDADSRFLRGLQRARLESLRTSRASQDYFAENYVGI